MHRTVACPADGVCWRKFFPRPKPGKKLFFGFATIFLQNFVEWPFARQGLHTYVTFVETPGTDFKNALKSSNALSARSEADRVLYVYDVKGFSDRMTLANSTRVWKAPPVLVEGHWNHVLESVFDPDESLFRANDCFLCFDGRRVSQFEKMRKSLNQATRKNPMFPNRLAAAPYRLWYGNEEFSSGYGQGKRVTAMQQSICHPDPVENCLLLFLALTIVLFSFPVHAKNMPTT